MTSMTHLSRACHVATFTSFDGAVLHYRHWPGLTPSTGKAVILFHRGHEHGGRMAHLVEELEMPDTAFFAWDARGLGKSSGERGQAEHFGALVKDADAFVRHVVAAHGVALADIAVIGQSVGAVIVATWVHDYAPPIRCMVLAAPAFSIKLYVPFARQGLALLAKARPKLKLSSYVKAKYLTHDPRRIASYEADPLIVRPIAVNLLQGVFEAGDRVVADASAITLPAQVLISGDDRLVHRKPQQAFFDGLRSPCRELHILDGYYHDTLGERDRAGALLKVRDFLARQFAAPCTPLSLRNADLAGPTQAEYERLARPVASLPARAWWYAARFWIRVGGALSEGLALGVKTGFDSGSMLDYVYRNQARGLTPLGRLVDRLYLNSIGWRGIRVRKVHLERMIDRAIDRLAAAGQPVRVLDIAAGHGRYVLEALARRRDQVAHALLRDYSELNVPAGRRMIAELDMQAIARFEHGNAFNRRSLATLSPRPTLAVVSGLYELFTDNELVRSSLAGLADAMDEGACLVYTGQPWHPRLKLIARTLTSHRDGQPWVMRRRTQGEIDQLVAAAGFEKLDQYTDQWGIFTVSLARRTGAASAPPSS